MKLTVNQKIDLCKNDYNSLLNTYKDMTKIFSILFAFLGGIVSAFVSLFTVYCVCGDNEISAIEWILFAVNVFAICGTACANLYGIFFDRMIRNEKGGVIVKEKSNSTLTQDEKHIDKEVSKVRQSVKEQDSNANSSKKKLNVRVSKYKKGHHFDAKVREGIKDLKQENFNDVEPAYINENTQVLYKLPWLKKYFDLLGFKRYDEREMISIICIEKMSEIEDIIIKNSSQLNDIKEIIMENQNKISEYKENMKEYNKIINKIIEKEDNTELLNAYNSLIEEVEKKIKIRRKILKIVCCCNFVLIVLMIATAIIFKVIA